MNTMQSQITNIQSEVKRKRTESPNKPSTSQEKPNHNSKRAKTQIQDLPSDYSEESTIETDSEELNESENSYNAETGFVKMTPIKGKNIEPTIRFKMEEVPKFYSDNLKISPPSTKNGKFTVNMSDEVISIIKGVQISGSSMERYDVLSEDNSINDILSHANASFTVSKVPEDCFKISSYNRVQVQAAYRALSRDQNTLKSLMFTAELFRNQYNTKDESTAQTMIKTFIHPVINHMASLEDSIRRLRAAAIPRFIPLSIKRELISAPIIPNQIWNIPPQLISRIQASRTEYIRKSKFRSSQNIRQSKPFSNRGRFFDRRIRPQRRSGQNSQTNRRSRNDQDRNNQDRQ